MTGETGLITVYRSADMNAEEDANGVRNALSGAGIEAWLCDASTPGVVTGTYEVRVPAEQAGRAESIIAGLDFDDPGRADPGRADPSRELDMVTVSRTMGTTGEVQALGIKGVLDSNGIDAVIVGSSTMPNLSFFVNVAKSDFDRALAAIAEAEAAGPAAAVEGERESEGLPPEA